MEVKQNNAKFTETNCKRNGEFRLYIKNEQK